MKAGTLEIELLTNVAKLQNDMQQMKRAVNDATASAGRDLSGLHSKFEGLTSAAKGFLGILSAGAIFAAGKRALEYASSLGEVAQQLGVTTKDLQTYRYAATQVGIAQEDMDKGLAKLTQTLGKARLGAAEPAKAFGALSKLIGQDIVASSRTAGDALPLIAKALEKVRDPATRAAAEIALFGKAGQKLDTLLAGGKGEIDNLSRAAQELGIVLSDQQIQKADETADKIAAFKMVLESKLASTVADNAGAILTIANAIATVADKVGFFFRTMEGVKRLKRDEGWFSGMLSSPSQQDAAADPAQYIRYRQTQLANAVAAMDASRATRRAGGIGAALGDGTDPALAQHIANVRRETEALRNATADLTAANRAAAGSMGANAAGEGGSVLGQFLAGSGGGSKTDKAAAAAKKLATELAGVQRSLVDLDGPAQKYIENLRIIADAEAAGLIGGDAAAQLRSSAFMQRVDAEIEIAEKQKAAMISNLSPELQAAFSKPFEATTGGLAEMNRQLDLTKASFSDFINMTAEIDLDGVFGNTGKAFGSLLNSLDELIDRQEAYSDAVAKGGLNFIEMQQAQAKNFRLQINSYGSLAGAAKGFFKEGTTGYKALEAAETAFRTVELALALQNAATKLGLLGSVTAAKVASDATMAASDTTRAGVEQGNSIATTAVKAVEAVVNAIRSVPFPLNLVAGAMTAAAIAALGVSIFSGGGGGGMPSGYMTAEDRQKAQGAGSVLGDSQAKSESISKALDIMKSNSVRDLEYSNKMVRSLQSIEQNIGGLTNILAREFSLPNGGFAGSTATGSSSKSPISGSMVGSMVGGALLGPVGWLVGPILSQIPVIGDILGAIGKFIYNVKVKVTMIDQGLQFSDQYLADVIANGFDGQTYADYQIKKKKKMFGIGVGGSTKYKTEYGALDDGTANQIGLIIGQIRDTIVDAAKVLGLDVAATLDKFKIEIGKVSLKDMTADEISKTLENVFSKLADDMAGFAVEGLTDFQKAGEGLFETLSRLARDYLTIDAELKSIGMVFGAVGAASIGARENLIDLFGSLQDFIEQTDYYRENFLTGAEQIAPVMQAVTAEMNRLGLAGVDTIDEFKHVVSGIDLTTTAGQELFAALMAVAPAFYQVEQYQADQVAKAAEIEQQKRQMEIRLLELTGKSTDAAEALARSRQMELDAMDPALRALQKQIYLAEDVAGARDVLSKAYERESAALEATAKKFRAFADGLKSFRDTLGGNGSTPTYSAALVKLMTTGGLAAVGNETALGSLENVSRSFLTVAKDNAGSLLQYQRDVAMVARYVDAGIGAATDQADTAEQSLAELKTSVSNLIEINENVVTVRDAIVSLQTLLAQQTASVAATTAPEAVQAQAERDARQERIERHLDQIRGASVQGTISQNELARLHRSWDRRGAMAVTADADEPLPTTAVA